MNTQLQNHQVKHEAPVNGYDENAINEHSKLGNLKLVNTENELAVLMLDDNGMIRDCNMASAKLLGCASSILIWQHISKFLPQLSDFNLIDGERVNPHLRFLTRIGHHFEVITTSGTHFFSAVFFNDVEDFGRHCLRIIFQPVTHQAF